MGLDIRIPIGLLFLILGCLLVFYGLISGGRSLDINVNLWWGLIMLAFGAGMFFAGWGKRSTEPGDKVNG